MGEEQIEWGDKSRKDGWNRRDGAVHMSWSYGEEWNCETSRGTEGFPDYKDKNGSEGISQLDWLLPEVHTKFCGDSSAIVRSHQEDSS